MPKYNEADLSIDFEGFSRLPFGSIYNFSTEELRVLRAYIDENLERGFIRPWSSPAKVSILLSKKKDSDLRLCVDYRSLNRITTKNHYPLPLIREALDHLVGAKVYTKLNVRNAYHIIRIAEGDKWKMGLRTWYGHFEYQVMRFDLANGPVQLQGYINSILQEYLDIFALAYMNNILIYNEDKTEYETYVWKVLQRL